MSVTISKDEWLAALKEAGLERTSDDEALTVYEFMTLTGHDGSRITAERMLSGLVARGKAVKTQKLHPRSDGRMQMMAAYRLLK